MKTHFLILAGVGLGLSAFGCGGSESPTETPVASTPIPGANQFSGTIEGADGEVTLRFFTALGAELAAQTVEIDYSTTPYSYTAVVFPDTDFPLHNIRVVASFGSTTLKAIVAHPEESGNSLNLDINAVSTTLALALELKPVPRGKGYTDGAPALASFPCEGIDLFTEAIGGQIFAESGPAFELFKAVSQELSSGATHWPDVIKQSSDLDAKLADLAVAAGDSASADGTLEDGFYRVIIGVVRIQDYPDHKCFKVDINKWVTPDEGDSLFLVGGIHEDSPIQDPTIQNDVLPNWVPNTLPMYDDGTHGDEISGDNLWTRSFVFPKGLRIGYKYTFGTQGQNWTGTEEWPGNQRLLEVLDVNGDGYVARFDVFADERSNKDKQNMYESGGTTLNWDTDLNGDGYFEALEMPTDFIGGDCVIDGFWQPLTLPPVTTEGCF